MKQKLHYLLFFFFLISVNLKGYSTEKNNVKTTSFYTVNSETTIHYNGFPSGTGSITNGWTKSSKVYNADPGSIGQGIRLGKSSTTGYIISPTLDCSANGGNFTVRFDALRWSSSENRIIISHAADGSNFDDSITQDLNSISWETLSFDFTNGTANSKIKIETFSSSKERAKIDEFYVIQSDPNAPNLTINEDLIDFTYFLGNGPSAEQSFTLTGANITSENVSISLENSSAFEISTTSNGTFSNSLSIEENIINGQTITIYVRLKSSLTANSFNETLTINYEGGNSKTITLNGDVEAPSISVDNDYISGYDFEYTFGKGPSEGKYFEIDNFNISENITVTGSNSFEVSLDGTSYSTSVEILASSVNSSTTVDIYARLKAGIAVGDYDENLSINSSELTESFVNLNGTVNTPSINLNKYTLDEFSYTIQQGPSGSKYFEINNFDVNEDIIVTAPANFEVSLGTTNFTDQITVVLADVVNGKERVYIRLKEGLTQGNYSGNVILNSSELANVSVSVTGVVNAPSISIDSSNLDALSYEINNGPSDSEYFEIENISINTDLTVTAPTNYEISFDSNTNYTNILIIDTSESYKKVYVRLKAGLETGSYNETISVNSSEISEETISLLGSVNCPAISTPSSLNTSAVASNSFTANWDSVNGADDFSLTVTKIISENTILEEGFPNGVSPFPGNWSKNSRIYTTTSGSSGKAIRLGSGSGSGIITSPTIDCSTNGGVFKVIFDAKAYDGDELNMGIAHAADGSNFSDAKIIDVNLSWNTIEVTFTGGTVNSKIQFESHQSGGKRFYLDEIKIIQEESETIHNDLNIGNVTTYEVTGLDAETTYQYYVKANTSCGGGTTSEASSTVTVTTLVDPTFIWTTSGDNKWNNGANWNKGTVPTENDDVKIPLATLIDPVIENSESFSCNNIEIEDGMKIILNSDASNSASLIIKGNITGTGKIKYERHISATGWHYISSPISDLNILDLVTSSTPILNKAVGSDTKYAFGPYNNNAASYNQKWEYFTADGISGTEIMEAAKGYQMKLTADDKITFEGKPMSSASINVNTGNLNNWNFLGNPFTSAISVSTFLSENDSKFFDGFKALYLWNGANGEYDIVNLASSQSTIAIGQGFFIKVSSTSPEVINFTNTLKVHANDNFLRTSNQEEITLKLIQDSKEKTTIVKFIEETTNGFDDGYDALTFEGLNTEFGIYTMLPEEGNTDTLGLQCLPPNDSETIAIPVGIIAETNTTFSIKLDAENFESGKYIYLEDTSLNKFELMEENTEYIVILNSEIEKTERFKLHIMNSTLNVEDNILNNISVYFVDNSLQVSGNITEKMNINIYNTIGQKITGKTIQTESRIDLPSNTSEGIYIIQLEGEKSSKTIKLFLNK
ncbi:T9SS type A sorting domain-containing protein [Aureivirga sp. CE67]|uniref:T9SS type A sorting domain-containing protein n=1 Tax=Aureivirga sp. CE67 TaxID=1788983 RepID=UPI0018C960EF|nr:T9SS type A sorting domain-containing protein [Aureivirga sp. CE67]